MNWRGVVEFTLWLPSLLVASGGSTGGWGESLWTIPFFLLTLHFWLSFKETKKYPKREKETNHQLQQCHFFFEIFGYGLVLSGGCNFWQDSGSIFKQKLHPSREEKSIILSLLLNRNNEWVSDFWANLLSEFIYAGVPTLQRSLVLLGKKRWVRITKKWMSEWLNQPVWKIKLVETTTQFLLTTVPIRTVLSIY